jgi:hypothetical protein
MVRGVTQSRPILVNNGGRPRAPSPPPMHPELFFGALPAPSCSGGGAQSPSETNAGGAHASRFVAQLLIVAPEVPSAQEAGRRGRSRYACRFWCSPCSASPAPPAGATRRTAAACLHCRRAHAGVTPPLPVTREDKKVRSLIRTYSGPVPNE